PRRPAVHRHPEGDGERTCHSSLTASLGALPEPLYPGRRGLRHIVTKSRSISVGRLRATGGRIPMNGAPAPPLGALLHLDIRALDERPPLVDLGLVKRGKRLRRHLLVRRQILSQID